MPFVNETTLNCTLLVYIDHIIYIQKRISALPCYSQAYLNDMYISSDVSALTDAIVLFK